MTAEWAYGGSEGGGFLVVMGIAIIACKTQAVVDLSIFILSQLFFFFLLLIYLHLNFAIEASRRHMFSYIGIVVDMWYVPRS